MTDYTFNLYTHTQWAGLLRTYYRPRWELFLNQTLAQLRAPPVPSSRGGVGSDHPKGHGAQLFDIGRFHAAMYKWYDGWREADHAFPAVPSGDAVAESRRLYRKYGRALQLP